MSRLQRIAAHDLAVGLGVKRVQVDALHAGKECHHLLQVLPEFIAVAGATGEIAGGHDAATVHCAGFDLEAADIIALPAMERDGNRERARHRRVGIHAQTRIRFVGVPVVVLGFGGRRVGEQVSIHLLAGRYTTARAVRSTPPLDVYRDYC